MFLMGVEGVPHGNKSLPFTAFPEKSQFFPIGVQILQCQVLPSPEIPLSPTLPLKQLLRSPGHPGAEGVGGRQGERRDRKG